MAAYNKKVEALAEGIVRLTGYSDPTSALYQARNPGGIKASSPEQKQTKEGYRQFGSVIDGYQSLFMNLSVMLSGKSKCRLTPSSPLSDLARQFHITVARPLVLFLRAALKDETLTANTPLSYFQE
jgi:hypothetical protein